MVLVPANMSRLSFGPGKIFFCFGPCKIFCFLKQSLQGLFSETKNFVGTKNKKKVTTKWVQSSCATHANHHKNGVRDYFKKQKILQGPKIIFFLQGPKLKRGIFAETSAIFKPLIIKQINQVEKCCVLAAIYVVSFFGPNELKSSEPKSFQQKITSNVDNSITISDINFWYFHHLVLILVHKFIS